METLKFTTDRKTVPVVLTIDGTEEDFVIREFQGKNRQAYMSEVMDSLDIGGNLEDMQQGKMEVRSIKGNISSMQVNLIALCLYRKDEETPVKDQKPVELSFIEEFPVATVAGLFKACQELNGLGKDADETAKND